MGVSKIVAVALVLLLWHPACLRADSIAYFLLRDVLGLQSLWGAWNESTPSRSSNLLHWCTYNGSNDQQVIPCYNAANNWRGVSCLRYNVNDTVSNTWVVGLELEDASIVGILPSGVGQLTKLVSLKLTGNPDLTGSLPKELANIPLNILDLHDNGFNGAIPVEILNIHNLLELDLSGNQLSGDFPFENVGQTATMQVLKIGQNSFTGTVPPNAFENMTQLLTLDLSGNEFTGPAPTFNNTFANPTLYSLNLSRNSFSKLPELPQIFKSWLPPNVSVLDLSGLNIGGSLPADWNAHPDLLSREELHLDEINISGILNITSLLFGIQNLTPATNSNSRNLSVLSLMNNSITDVIFERSF